MEVTKFDDQVKMGLIFQSISGVTRNFPKLLKFFNGAALSATFVLSSAGVFPVVFTLDLE